MKLRFPFLASAFRGDQLNATVILLLSPLLMVTWWYFGTREFYFKTLYPHTILNLNPDASAALYWFAMTFFLLGLVPAMVVKLVFRQRLADYGVQFGVPVRTVRSFLIWGPVFVLCGYIAAQMPAVRTYYPTDPGAGASPGCFARHALALALFYLGWEFHFRGFMQFGLRRAMGEANALLVVVLVSCLLHVGRPAVETYLSLLGGLLWGLLAFHTRSILSGTLQHYLLALSLDWFLCCR